MEYFVLLLYGLLFPFWPLYLITVVVVGCYFLSRYKNWNTLKGLSLGCSVPLGIACLLSILYVINELSQPW